MTLVILYLYLDITGKKIVHYFLTSQRISCGANTLTLSAANEH